MKQKWLPMAASVLALAGTALAGCGPQGNRPPGYPIVQPTQTDRPDGAATASPMDQAAPTSTATPEPEEALEASATAVPMHQAAPASTATLAPAQAPVASATAAEATATLRPGAPAGEADSRQASNEAVEKAKADLAKKLGIPTSDIAVVLVIGQEFSTDAFFCRATKDRSTKDESPAAISGLSILLKASGRRYEYHASGQTVIFCRPLA